MIKLRLFRTITLFLVVLFACTLVQPLYYVAAQESEEEATENSQEETTPQSNYEAPNDTRAIDLDSVWYKTYDGQQCSGVGAVGAPDNIPQVWKDIIWGAAPKYPEVDPRIVATVLWVENRGWPEFKSEGWDESKAGARGPFQFIASTWFGKNHGGWVDVRNEANYAPNAMGTDGDGDGVRDPLNPKDAVEAAFKHHRGSAGKPIAGTGFDPSKSPTANLDTVVFERDGSNLLSFASAYNGSGAPQGVILSAFPRKENADYVILAFWLLASNFTYSYNLDSREPIPVKAEIKGTGGANENESEDGAPTQATGACGVVGEMGVLVPGGFAWPTQIEGSRVTSCYGERIDPITGLAGGHRGIDISIGADTPAFAVADGEVVFAGEAGGYGPYFVAIKHAGGVVSSYGHMNSMTVSVGEQVKQAQKVGTIGSRGKSTGPHMHLNISQKGDMFNGDVDPFKVGLAVPPGVPNTAGC